MRNATRWAMATMLAVGLGVAAFAQPPGGGRFPGGGMMSMTATMASTFGMVANNKALQEELKITEEQTGKLKEAGEGIMKKMREAGAGFGGAGGGGARPDEETMKKFREAMTKVGEETKAAVEGVLKPEQLKRLKEIGYQRMGVMGAVEDKDAVAALKISDDQKDKFKSIVEAYNKDVAEIRKDMPRGAFGRQPSEEDRKKMEDVRKKSDAVKAEAEEKLVEKMTDDQKKAWKEMIGTKFDLTKLQQRPMRRDS
jgi:hypothetical protein